MKAAGFAYLRPTTVEEAVAALGRDGVVVLAGGQTLVPDLVRRRLRPRALVDISRIETLATISAEKASVVIGAAATQRNVERSASVKARCPPLAQALRTVGTPAIRTLGTIVGSLALNAPAAQIPLVALLCGAVVDVASSDGNRSVPVEEAEPGENVPLCEVGELATRVRFEQPAGSAAVVDFRASRVREAVSAAVLVAHSRDGSVATVRAVVAGEESGRRRVTAADVAVGERALTGPLSSEIQRKTIQDLRARGGSVDSTAIASLALVRALGFAFSASTKLSRSPDRRNDGRNA